MKLAMGFVLFAVMAVPGVQAKKAQEHEQGVLLSMDSKACGAALKTGKSLTGELLGTDSQKKQTQEVLCQEYTLQTDRIVYRIRPKDEKHAVLLPIGQTVEFRIEKDSMYLRNLQSDRKERQYTVVSMQPRQDANDTKDTHNNEAKN